MIKNIFLFCAALIILNACNNEAKEKRSATLPAAEISLRDAIAKYPDSLLLKENLVQYFRENSNYGEAIAETNNAIKKDSANARLWDIKAILHLENTDTTNAIKAFEEAVAYEPQPTYVLSLGTLYAQTRNKSALNLADKLLAAPNANAGKEAFFIKGLYFSAINDKQQAITFFDKCLALDYMDVLTYKEKAICLYDLAKYKEAIQTLEKAVTIQSTFDEGYYWLGRCYEKTNQPKDAADYYKTALQIDPDYAEAKDALLRLGQQ